MDDLLDIFVSTNSIKRWLWVTVLGLLGLGGYAYTTMPMVRIRPMWAIGVGILFLAGGVFVERLLERRARRKREFDAYLQNLHAQNHPGQDPYDPAYSSGPYAQGGYSQDYYEDNPYRS